MKGVGAVNLERHLLDRIAGRNAHVAVIGLGYVGLPLAVASAKAGFTVVGIEQRSDRVSQASRGESYVLDVPDKELSDVVGRGTLRTTEDYAAVAESDVILICVPTPLGAHKNPDTSFIEGAVQRAGPLLRPGQLLILESTTYPGTTEDILKAQVEARGLAVGREVFLAFSPERIDPGSATHTLRDIPKVVGGMTEACTRVAAAFYRTALAVPVTSVSSPRVAEMTKLLENIFRVVNVSLVNELALLCDRMQIDIWEVIEAAKTKPFGYMPFYPGPGMGGHCIPVDAFYLAWKAKEYGVATKFIELAGEINDSMPDYVVRRTTDILNERARPLRGARVLLLGLAYKRDVDDLRESPALKIAERLLRAGADVRFHDPLIPRAEIAGRSLSSVPLSAAALDGVDLVLVTTDHSRVDYAWILEHAPVIFDTRGVFRTARADHVYRLGGGWP